MKVSDYIVKAAADAGIRDCFMVTGGGAMHLDDSFGHSSRIKCTFNHHEQASAMAAEAYARVSNTPAAVLVTTGPGAVNALTGVLCAWMESIPMLVISGQARFATTVRGMGLDLRSTGIQEYDITKSSAPMTKYSVMITDAGDVRYCVEKALYLMMEGRRGPVWLDIPLDVQAADIDPKAQKSFLEEMRGTYFFGEYYEKRDGSDLGKKTDESHSAARVRNAADVFDTVKKIPKETIRQILSRLRTAKRPILFGGAGVRASGGEKEFLELANILGAPVLTGMSSIDLISEDDPLYAGRTGVSGTRAGNLAMASSDVFLSIGSRLSFIQTGFDYREWARGAYTIVNEIDPEELRKPNVHVSLPVIGDARAFMRQLIEAVKKEQAEAAALSEKDDAEKTEGAGILPDAHHDQPRDRGTAGEEKNRQERNLPWCEAAGGWLARCKERCRIFPAVTEAEKAPQPDGKANIYRFYDVLSDLLPAGKTLLVSCGTSRVAGEQAFCLKPGQRFYTNSGTASMGYDLPAAIGLAEALRTERRAGKNAAETAHRDGENKEGVGKEKESCDDVTLVTGDGSIMMNLQEMQTIATNHFPVRIFLICNGGYHSIRQTQNAYFGKPLIGVGPESGDLDFPDPEKVAGLFGFSFGQVLSNETIARDMEAAMRLPLPALIRVEVTTSQKTEPKAASRKLPDGTMVSSPLEDMAPFLPRDVLRENLEIELTEGEA